MKRINNGRGFTLIELLVVITIISILAGMLLTGLSKANGHAKKIVCVNNMKQIGVACYVYEGDNDKLPNFLGWLYTYRPESDPNYDTDEQDDALILKSPSQGLVFPYIKNEKTFLCPNDIQKQKFAKHSYIANCFSCHVKDSGQIKFPSQTMYFMEKTNCFPSNKESLNFWYEKPIFNHNNGTVLLKMDTHVEILNQKQFVSQSTNKSFWFPTSKDTYN